MNVEPFPLIPGKQCTLLAERRVSDVPEMNKYVLDMMLRQSAHVQVKVANSERKYHPAQYCAPTS